MGVRTTVAGCSTQRVNQCDAICDERGHVLCDFERLFWGGDLWVPLARIPTTNLVSRTQNPIISHQACSQRSEILKKARFSRDEAAEAPGADYDAKLEVKRGSWHSIIYFQVPEITPDSLLKKRTVHNLDFSDFSGFALASAACSGSLALGSHGSGSSEFF